MANKKRLIDANELVLEELLVRNPYEYFDEFASGVRKVMNVIRRLPTVDAVEVVHSSWILNDDGSGTCKHCHRTTKTCWDFDNQMHFCPCCGADMR